jgi:hypothetical protein
LGGGGGGGGDQISVFVCGCGKSHFPPSKPFQKKFITTWSFFGGGRLLRSLSCALPSIDTTQ